ncbi:hypothetical protein PG987_002006 [Apiospora arundinis]
MAVDDDDDNELEDEWEDEWEDELRNEKMCRILKDAYGIDSPCANLRGMETFHGEFRSSMVSDFSCDCQFCGPILPKISEIVKKRPGEKISSAFVHPPKEGSSLSIGISTRDIIIGDLDIDIYTPTVLQSSQTLAPRLPREPRVVSSGAYTTLTEEVSPYLERQTPPGGSTEDRNRPERELCSIESLLGHSRVLDSHKGQLREFGTERALGKLAKNLPGCNQNSREDWEEQSACMGDIYRNATVVIAANSGSGAHEGFLGPRKEHFVECIVPPSSASPGVYARPHILHYHKLSTDETLSKRAWTYQERLLARRYLSFNKKELHWECESAWQCECGVGEWTKSSPHEFSLQQLCNFTMNKEELYKVWRQVIVQNYSGRELSKESDELPALSAVAQVFQTKLQDTYLAGLWNGDIIRGLCWVRYLSFEDFSNGPSSYRAPSWAWSSIDAPAYDCSGQQEFVTYSHLLEAECVPFGASNLGEVKDGFITLRGPLVRAFIGLSAYGFNPGKIVQVWTFNVRDGSSAGYPEKEPTRVSNFRSDSPLRKYEAIEDNCTHISLLIPISSPRHPLSMAGPMPKSAPTPGDDTARASDRKDETANE